MPDNIPVTSEEARVVLAYERRIAELEAALERAGERAHADGNTASAQSKRITVLEHERDDHHREYKGEVWHWQDDGEDHPESLTCPVAVSPDVVRRWVAAEAKLAVLESHNKALAAGLQGKGLCDESDAVKLAESEAKLADALAENAKLHITISEWAPLMAVHGAGGVEFVESGDSKPPQQSITTTASSDDDAPLVVAAPASSTCPRCWGKGHCNEWSEVMQEWLRVTCPQCSGKER